MCWPVEEGGLGLRGFEDVATAFSMKLWWQLCNSTSLWSTYMQAKYCHGIYIMDAVPTLSSSHVWIRILSVKDLVERRIGWGVGKGLISIHENWLNCTTLSLPNDHEYLHTLFMNSQPRANYIYAKYGPPLLVIIEDRGIYISDVEDTLFCLPSPSGRFFC